MNDPNGPQHVEIQVHLDDLLSFAEKCGLARIAPDRVSHHLLLDLYCRANLQGAEDISARVIHQIGVLEGLVPGYGMKGAEPFERAPLRGLLKAHYLPPAGLSVPTNVKNEMGKQKDRVAAFIREQRRTLGTNPTD